MQEVGSDGYVYTLGDQEAFDAVDVASAFCFQGEESAVEVAFIFGFRGRGADDAPDLFFAAVVADQHGEEFADIHMVGFDPFSSAGDFDASGIHDQVFDVLGDEVAVEPEAIASSFVATEDAGVGREEEAFFSREDFLLEGDEVASGDGAFSGFLAEADGEAESPFCVT